MTLTLMHFCLLMGAIYHSRLMKDEIACLWGVVWIAAAAVLAVKDWIA